MDHEHCWHATAGREGALTVFICCKCGATKVDERNRGVSAMRLIVTVRKCSACGGEHSDMEFSWVANQELLDGELYSFEGRCPVSGKPVFMQVQTIGETGSALETASGPAAG